MPAATSPSPFTSATPRRISGPTCTCATSRTRIVATNQETGAQIHAAQYDPNASASTKNCSAKGACWTSTTNPTTEHLDEAKKDQRMAADHRAASQALRGAEAQACVGLADADRDTSPFAHRDDIASVEPLVLNAPAGKGQTATRMAGAVITFRAAPGMTAPWLQRVVDCHLARNAALGHDEPEMAKDVTARVTATDTGFAVAVSSKDAEGAKEVLGRARALGPR